MRIIFISIMISVLCTSLVMLGMVCLSKSHIDSNRMIDIEGSVQNLAREYVTGEFNMYGNCAKYIDKENNTLHYTVVNAGNSGSAEVGILILNDENKNKIYFYGVDLPSSRLYVINMEGEIYLPKYNPFYRNMMHDEMIRIIREFYRFPVAGGVNLSSADARPPETGVKNLGSTSPPPFRL